MIHAQRGAVALLAPKLAKYVKVIRDEDGKNPRVAAFDTDGTLRTNPATGELVTVDQVLANFAPSIPRWPYASSRATGTARTTGSRARMPAEQTGYSKRKRRPKTRSTHRRGGDRVSVKAKTEQAKRDAETFRMRVQGFDFPTIATYLGIGEEAVRIGYWRAVRSQSLATIEESRGHALAEIEQRRQLIWIEIRKVQATLGADGKKRFDAGELRSYMEMLNALAIRQARLMGLDSPVKLGIGWTGAPLGGDVLTTEQLNRLDVNQLRQLFELLEVARTGNGASIDAESRPVMETTLNFPPTPPKPATPEPELLAEPPEVEVMRRESTERYRPLREAEQIVAKLNVTDPTLRIGYPIVRAEMAKAANKVLIDFGRRPWREWMQN